VRLTPISSIALAGMLAMATVGARAHDETKYPDWGGQWKRIGGVQWDPSKPPGRAQQPPLTEEYQAVFEAGLADQAVGGQGNDPLYRCIPPGMPRQMAVVFPMEFVILPNITYMAFEQGNVLRRIYTDKRDWPAEREPSFAGYSIGQWEDEDGDGRYDALVVETRGIKGPRSFDPSGIPLHVDNQTIVKERLSLDKADRDLLHNEITTIDHALTRPWIVTRSLTRERNQIWFENNCAEDNHHVVIGKENYFVTADGYLMPTKKGQPAPDPKYFNRPRR
jgi:hypothetical protein